MRHRFVMAAGLGAAVLAVATAPTALAAAALSWNAPKTITSGVPFDVSSIDPCPPAPTPGDQVLVGIFVSLKGGGGFGNTLTANSDGSWSGSLTFTFSNAGSSGTISATCEDYNGVSATPYAQYQSKHVKLVA